MSNGTPLSEDDPTKLFKLVENEAKGAFNDEATDLIYKGYVPVGGVTVFLVNQKSTYVQAFWRPDFVAKKAYKTS